MDKSTNTGSKTESFKNTPHVAAGNTDFEANASTRSGANRSESSSASNSGSGAMSSSTGRFADAKNAIVEQATPAIDYVRTNFRPVLDQGQQYLGKSQDLVRSYPFYAMAGAAVVGVFVGMMFSRSSRSNV